MSGMSEWGSLKDLVERTNKQSQIAETKKSIPAWMVPPKHIPSNFGDEPATEKQKDYLLTFGVTIPANLTKYDASRWLDLLVNNKEVEKYLSELAIQKENAGYWADGHKTLSGKLRSERDLNIKSAEKEFKEAKDEIAELKAEGDMDVSEEKEMMAEALENLKEWDEERDNCNKTRIGYWMWIIKLSKLKGSEYEKLLEDGVGEIMYDDIEEHEGCFGITTEWSLLYSLIDYAKCVKKIPDKRLISEILDLLDSESPTWDDDTPELLLKRLAEKMA
jgi:hypothetical protein